MKLGLRCVAGSRQMEGCYDYWEWWVVVGAKIRGVPELLVPGKLVESATFIPYSF